VAGLIAVAAAGLEAVVVVVVAVAGLEAVTGLGFRSAGGEV